MFRVFTSSVVDHEFEFRSCEAKDYKIDICCLSAKHAALTSMNKDWLVRNQDNVSGHMSTRGLLFSELSRYHYQDTIKRVDLLQSGHHHLIVI